METYMVKVGDYYVQYFSPEEEYIVFTKDEKQASTDLRLEHVECLRENFEKVSVYKIITHIEAIPVE